MKRKAVIICIMLYMVSVVSAETVIDTLEASKDTYIDAFNMDTNHGFETSLTLWNESDPQYFILIQFPLPMAYQCMPDTQDLVSANLGMYCYYSGGSGTANVTGAYDSWGEGSVNYNNMPDIFEGPSVTGTTIPDMNGSWYSANVTPIVNSWLNGYDYIGFYVTANNPYTSWDFFSKDCDTCLLAADDELTPKLYLTWETSTGIQEESLESTLLEVTSLSTGAIQIDYSLNTARSSSLIIYDAAGALVASYHPQSGNHSISFNSSPGVYFVKLRSGSEEIVKKAVCVR